MSTWQQRRIIFKLVIAVAANTLLCGLLSGMTIGMFLALLTDAGLSRRIPTWHVVVASLPTVAWFGWFCSRFPEQLAEVKTFGIKARRTGANPRFQNQRVDEKQQNKSHPPERIRDQETKAAAAERAPRPPASVVKDEAFFRSVLGVGSDASPTQIKRRYRELVAQHHPDKVAHLAAR
jgi:hypothetical protein